MISTGTQAPAFELEDLEGRLYRSAGSEAPVLYAFFKVSCPTCQLMMPFLDRLAGNRGAFPVMAISQDDAAATRAFNQRFGLNLPTLIDRRGYPVSNAFDITHVPSLFLVEPGGAIAHASNGFSKSDLEMLARQAGVEVFHPGEDVPAWKAG